MRGSRVQCSRCGTEAPEGTVNCGSHLRLIVQEYIEHYHRERNHQGLENQLLERALPPANPGAEVQRAERLGGLLSHYHREAA